MYLSLRTGTKASAFVSSVFPILAPQEFALRGLNYYPKPTSRLATMDLEMKYMMRLATATGRKYFIP